MGQNIEYDPWKSLGRGDLKLWKKKASKSCLIEVKNGPPNSRHSIQAGINWKCNFIQRSENRVTKNSSAESTKRSCLLAGRPLSHFIDSGYRGVAGACDLETDNAWSCRTRLPPSVLLFCRFLFILQVSSYRLWRSLSSCW